MSNVTRVLHAVGSMNRGGQETFIMNVYRNIDRKKLQFDFLLNNPQKCDYEDEITAMGGIIYRIPRRFPNYFAHLRALDNFMKNHRYYGVVHQHANSCSAISSLIYAKKYKVNKIVFHSHSSKPDAGIIPIIFNFIYKPRISKYATHYFACSDSAADNLFGKYIGKSEIRIIRNAIDSERYAIDDVVRTKIRMDFGFGSKYVIGHVGRFSREKNHSFLLDVFRAVHNANPDTVLLLVGDGELRGDITEKVKSINLENHVIFTGIRSDIPDLLFAMDVLLFPSLWEGLGMVLIEAQASGLHCIVSDTVPKEAQATELLEYVSLRESASSWADSVLKYVGVHERQDMQCEIKNAGFSIGEVALALEQFYTE